MALAAATAFVAPRQGLRVGLITIDHGLQDTSADQAESVAQWAQNHDFDPVLISRVTVGTEGGPEAAARDARYAALDSASDEHGAEAVLLGHTRDDQAETVLLGLARGSGARAIAGMPRRRDHFRRPMLDIARADTREACRVQNLPVWDDPHNSDPAYARSRVRGLLPELADVLGPGVIPGLARTARLIRADNEYLDMLAERALIDCTDTDGGLSVDVLERQPEAIRTRVLHSWAIGLGATAGAVGVAHVDALDALVTQWRGQGEVALPGGVFVVRTSGRLTRMPGRDNR